MENLNFSVWWNAEFFNDKFTMNRYCYAESEYNNLLFFDKSIVQKLFYFKLIFPIQYWRNSNFIFHIFSMLFDII